MKAIRERLLALELEPARGREFTPATEEEANEIEKRIGTTLPEGYRRFLTTYGSSLFAQDVFYRDPTCRGPVLFGWFYGASDIRGAMEPFAEALPNDMIAIGDDGGGNLYVLGLSGSDRNKIFFHNHNIGWNADARRSIERDEEVPDELRLQTVHQIADSFEAFIDGMFHRA